MGAGGDLLFTKFLQTKRDWKLTLIRVVAGGVMLPHGMQKMFGWFGGPGFSATMRVLPHLVGIPAWLIFFSILAEFFGALGMILGCLSRIAAFGVLMDMIGAGALSFRFGFFMNWAGAHKGEGIEYHLLMGTMALTVMIWGGGAFSIDRALTGNRDARSPSRSGIGD
jgi:putative oxidoreductase